MKEIKYIGIRGHRGSGKNTIAYILGNLMQYLIDTYGASISFTTTNEILSDKYFDVAYKVWCDCIKRDESKALNDMNTPNVYLESFGDTPRILLQLITNIPIEYFYSDYYKDHIIVQLKDFSWSEVDNTEEFKIDINQLIQKIENGDMDEVDNSNLKLTLRDLIVYFATVNMKYMGQSIWVKSVKCSEMNNSYEEYYNIGQQYKIFRDIKASTELTYIKDHNGIIIKVNRPKFKKSVIGVESLDNDNRYDYNITINSDIENDITLKHNLLNIALDILRS